MDCYGHHNASRRQSHSICGRAILEALPVRSEADVVYVSIDPVAVVEIVLDEPVDNI